MVRGSYLLVFRLDSDLADIAIGRFGRFAFSSGWYVYVGSAMGSGGLTSRLAYHRQKQKAHPHWHIDYLRPFLRLYETWAVGTSQRLECRWCQSLGKLPQLSVPVRGFGSRDTGCPTHLFYATTYPGVRALTTVVLGTIAQYEGDQLTMALDITTYDEA